MIYLDFDDGIKLLYTQLFSPDLQCDFSLQTQKKPVILGYFGLA